MTDALALAFAEDQISVEERERRVASALHAGRLQQLADLVADLQLPADHPATRLLPVGAHAAAGTAGTAGTGWGRGPKVALAVAGTLGVLAVVGAVVDGADEERDVRPMTADGYRLFVAEYDEKFGSTEAYRAELLEEYVSVVVPVDGGEGRYRNYYWDDDGFSYADNGGTVPEGAVTLDLADVDADRLVENLERALDSLQVEDPEPGRVIVDDAFDPGYYRAVNGLGYRAPVPPHVQITVTNEFSEQGSLATDLSGDEVLATTPFAG